MMVTNQKEMYYRYGIWQLNITTKLKPGDNFHVWSPTIPRRVYPQPMDGRHQPSLALLGPIWTGLPMFGLVWLGLTSFNFVKTRLMHRTYACTKFERYG